MALKRGFKAVKEEKAKREKESEKRKGRLWRIFFPKDADEDYEIPVTFLTDEPINFNEHTLKKLGKFDHVLCTADDGECSACDSGDKPRFVGAFLVFDGREYEVEERDSNGNKTGEKVIKEGNIKLLVRGIKDLTLLTKRKKKHGLLGNTFNLYKTGSGQSTVWNYDYEGESEYTMEEVESYLPDMYREDQFKDEDGNIDPYAIVEYLILSSADADEESEEPDEGYEEEQEQNLRRVGDKSSKASKPASKGKLNKSPKAKKTLSKK